jgi:ABC-2 type transport system permease protein
MWFLAIMAINSMSVDLESEARQGTLEQLFLHAPNLTALIWVRGIVHLLMGSGAVAVLLVAIQLTTGHWLPLRPPLILPALITLVLTTLSLLGCGLAFGGLALVYKRIGQLAAILQFALFLLAFTDLSKLPAPWDRVAAHAPFVSGLAVIKLLFGGGAVPWLSIASLALDTAIYAALGTLAFAYLKRCALRGGLLSHY